MDGDMNAALTGQKVRRGIQFRFAGASRNESLS